MAILDLNRADVVRAELTKEQSEEIISMFTKLRKQVDAEIRLLKNTKSGALQKIRLEEIRQLLNREMANVYDKFKDQLSGKILKMAEAVIGCNKEFFLQAGISIESAYANMPMDVLKSIMSGEIYDRKWFLSESIWKDMKSKQDDISRIITQGRALGKSSFQIAQDLEKYVDPKAAKPWNWSKVYPGSAKKIDYNAQRLARTITSHAYQKSIIETTKDNPFAKGIEWFSALSERSCEICIDRNGKIFTPEDLPMDHPNGMCTWAVYIPDSMMDISNRLAGWVNGNEDRELDSWYSKLVS